MIVIYGERWIKKKKREKKSKRLGSKRRNFLCV